MSLPPPPPPPPPLPTRRCRRLSRQRASKFDSARLPACLRACSRQFGHRVKGVSMSTFKSDEVAALEESGNAVGG